MKISPSWHWGTPDGSRELDRMLDARLTFRERLIWVEEIEAFALGAQSKAKKIDPERPKFNPPECKPLWNVI